jgi:hypothetical protein
VVEAAVASGSAEQSRAAQEVSCVAQDKQVVEAAEELFVDIAVEAVD